MAEPAPPAGRVRVLIVDDDDRFATAMMTTLLDDGRIDVIGIASDGTQALELSDELQPDVMLLDLNMPRMDGHGVLDAIREREHRPAVVVLTGATDKDDLERAAALGPAAVLRKTTDPDTLVISSVLAAALTDPNPPS